MADANLPAVKPEDFLALLKTYNPPEKLERQKDMLSGRYRILTAEPIAALSSPFAQAYAARDEESPGNSVYALVYDNSFPLRLKNIMALKTFRHPHLVALLDEGTAEISIHGEARYVVVFVRPAGQSLAEFLAQGRNPVSETVIITMLLRPLTEILKSFNELGISHNRINLSNIYIGDNTVQLGECVSEPSGFSQDPLFEPIDRLLASAWGKSDFSIGADCYALAIVTLHLALGFRPFVHLDKEMLINEILTKGSYHALAVQWELPDIMQDFFRGLLNDTHRDRWDPESISSWLAGRHFNLILPSQPRETSRAFEFAGQALFNRKAVAHAIHHHWDEARALLFDNRLTRWLETGGRKMDISDTVARVMSASNDNARSEKHNNEILARVIILLDPSGPIRLKQISALPDALGSSLAGAFLQEQPADLLTLTQIIESDILDFWIEQQKGGTDYSALVWKAPKIRTYLRMNSPGFGMERCLYDLFPGLACQSPLIKRYHITNLADLLYALDIVAVQKAGKEECMDRHISAFIASKLDLSREMQITELDMIPSLAFNSKLIALKLLMRAQHKLGERTLKGLCYWVSLMLLPVLDSIHKRSLRHTLQKDLLEAGNEGTLQAIANILLNPETFVGDYNEFQKAHSEYTARNYQIAELKNTAYLSRHARMAGRGIAQSLAYIIGFATFYYTLKGYFHF